MKTYRCRSQMFSWIIKAMAKGRSTAYIINDKGNRDFWYLKDVYSRTFFRLAQNLGYNPKFRLSSIEINGAWIRFLSAKPTGCSTEHSNILVIENSETLTDTEKADLCMIPVPLKRWKSRIFEIET